MRLDLYIGNKNYSSWSLRPWLLLKHLNIPFTEHMVSVAGRDYNPSLRSISENAKVPCLHVDGFQIWESLAIAEYLAEQYPQLWPADAKARARARSISAEMHAGFANLRKAMPMNPREILNESTMSRVAGQIAMIARRATKVVAGTTMPRSATTRARNLAATRKGTGFAGGLLRCTRCEGGQPFAASCALHPIPQNRVRDHVGPI